MANYDYDDPSTWRLETAGHIRYKLCERSGSFDFDQVTCNEVILIRASDLPAFLRESFPLPTMVNGLPRWQARGMPGSMPILTKTVSWSEHVNGVPTDPFNSDPDAPPKTYHPVIRVEITYNDNAEQPGSGGGGDANENDPETFLQIEASGAGEFLIIQSRNAQWQDDTNGQAEANTTADLPASRLVAETEWTITWPMLNYEFYKTVMVPRLRAARGTVNLTTYSLLYNAPAETLLLTGWDASEEHQVLFDNELPGGIDSDPQFFHAPVRLTVKMLEKNAGALGTHYSATFNPGGSDRTVYAGHNHIWQPKEGKWKRLLVNGLDENLYHTYEFANLFAVPTAENVP